MMSSRAQRGISFSRSLAAALLGMTLSGCGVGALTDSAAVAGGANGAEPWITPVPKATCGEADHPETGLQGQVPAEYRASGMSSTVGFSCNLERVGQFAGEGASWQLAWFEDCAYYDTATSRAPSGGAKPAQMHPGVAVIDATDRTAPTATEYLATSAMIDPWESLKVAHKRALLGAVNAYNGTGNGDLDFYDLSGDCRHPALLSSGSITPDGEVAGHEGNFAQDGLTYWIGDRAQQHYVAIDVVDPTLPKLVASWPNLGTTHGLSTNVAGDRAYFSRAIQNADTNGVIIADTSEVQSRAPNADVTVISEFYWSDGGQAQMTLPVKIGGREFLLQVDELGKGAARILNIEDDRAPSLAGRLMLEVHDPANADQTQEQSETALFGYEGHYCGVDDQENTTIVACGYFQSGLRVFDVRDPYHPKEIAYYNPPVTPGYRAGSNVSLTGECNTVDWASSMTRVDLSRGEIWFTTQCNGFQVVRFNRPLAEIMP
jgi:hypothetical protein